MLKKVKKLFNSTITEVPEILNKSYFPILDGFRGIAILIVIMSHVMFNAFFTKYWLGSVGVEIFFVLSGFLITTLLLKEKVIMLTVSLNKFYIRRLLRILPVAYLYLLVLIIFNTLFNLNINSTSFLSCFFFIRNIPLNYGTIQWYNGHFWTLAVEEQFYLLFPILLISNINIYTRVITSMIVIIPILQYLGYNKIGVFQSNYLIHKATFLAINLFGNGSLSILIGSLLSILVFKMIIKKINVGYFFTFSLFVLAIVIRVDYINLFLTDYIALIIFSLLIAVVIFLCLDSNDFLSKILKNKPLIKIGILSYSLYIWQQLFTRYPPWGFSWKLGNTAIFNIPLLFLVAYLSYTFYELKFLKLKNRFR